MKILIVEDDLGVADLIKEKLHEKNFDVKITSDANLAIEYLSGKDQPDLMILDYALPGMNATGFLKEIKTRNITVPPFIVSTGQGDERVAVEMMKLGARDYIVKDIYFLSKIPVVTERITREILKDNKLKEAEETIRIRDRKLIEEKQKLANIIKAANVGTWEWHIPSDKLTLNERCAEISGYSLDEILPVDVDGIKRFLHPEDLKLFRKAMRDHLNGIKDYYETEFRIWHKSGKWIWIRSGGCIMERDAEGNPVLLSGTHQDIDYKKQKEILEKEVEIAKQSAIFKQNFLANMSHEIRTPLTGLMGMIEMLSTTRLNETQKDYFLTLKNSAENLREIINQVLDFSKIEAGKIKLKTKAFSFVNLLHSSRMLFSHICQKNIKLNIHSDPDLPEFIIGDEIRITQVLNNLILNAVKHTKQGNISIHAFPYWINKALNQICIRIEVTDTGTGIKPEMRDKLFTPFIQIDENDTRPIDGSGLGLTICKELVKLHGGEIDFESSYGKGSKFWFTIVCELISEKDKKDVVLSTQLKSRKQRLSKLKILLAEDKHVNRKVIRLMLESLGHEVILANNGQEALEIYKPNAFDVILMDIQMPVMNGLIATRELKKTYENLPPVIGLSANAFEGDREKYMKQGMDDYITKPVKISELKQVLGKYN